MTLIILMIVAAGMSLIKRLDQEIKLSNWGKPVLVLAGMAGSGILRQRLGKVGMFSLVMLAILLGCLLLACITDLAICQVHNFVWWIGGAAVGLLLWAELGLASAAAGSILLELLVFCVIQMVLFGRLYGRADCYAYCVCAGAEAALGYNMAGFLTHMFLAFLLLAVVQALKRNISSSGRLKKPVPFLPYITAAFYLLLSYQEYMPTT